MGRQRTIKAILAIAAACALASCRVSGSSGIATAVPAVTATPRPALVPAPDFNVPALIGEIPAPTTTPTGSGGLQGVYYHYVVERGYVDFLRFYDDGLVLAVSVPTQNVFTTWNDIKAWFNRDTPDPTFAEGTYHLEVTTLDFFVTGPDGTVEYSGNRNVSTLTLVLSSQITGVQSQEIRYNFMATRGD